jgi:hypothetical protein
MAAHQQMLTMPPLPYNVTGQKSQPQFSYH